MTNEAPQELWWESVQPKGRMMRPKEVSHLCGLSISQIYEMIRQGEFPPFIKIGTRASAMPESWLNAFFERCVETAVGCSASPANAR
jgi:predicted DNA-binding transcriptional regulator AlpA